MKINIERVDEHFKMIAKNESGNEIIMDAGLSVGGHGSGFGPHSLLLAALGGCSSIDILLILKKQKQEVTGFEVEVESEKVKVESYSLFKEIVLHFKIKGKVDADKAEKAITLSLEKYCSVSKTLEPTAKITHKLTISD
ncbi:MAG: OsmC family protein [Sphingobacteriaceae bacterium]|nr:OsmC family protein [Sphingobacteriaceae bacterium]